MSAENNANYQVLARQWRPKQFADVVWQSHVTTALENALTAKRIHHAYLFTGTRGVGKTTLARIMAKCLSCQEGITAQPCDRCDHCLAINEGHFVDLIEVDAASRTRVEDTRELLDNAPYAPARGRYKIYLIDEVHMLSSHSFNALLKTLEEPPEHVKFLFATTDPQRLPATLLSRCLQFHLKAIPNQEIIQRLAHILAKENISAETDALTLVAQAAQGSLRDALSVLDQVIDFSDHSVKTQRTRTLLGLADPTLVLDILQAVVDNHPQTALISLDQLRDQCADLASVLDQLLEILQMLAVAKYLPSHLSQHPYHEQLIHLGDKLTAEDIQLYYQIVLHGRRDLAAVPMIEQGVQMTIIRLLAFAPDSATATTSASDEIREVQAVRKAPAVYKKQTVRAVNESHEKPNTPSATPSTLPSALPLASPTPVIASKTIHRAADWNTLIDHLALTGVTHTLAKHCSCAEWNGLQVKLLVAPSHAPFLSDTQKTRLLEALRSYTGENIQLQIAVAQSDIATPASLKTQQELEAKESTKRALAQDSALTQLLTAFDGKIESDSIVAITTAEDKT